MARLVSRVFRAATLGAIVSSLLWAGPARTAFAASTHAPAARREVQDRHGHVIAHLPPLWRDAACAPALYSIMLRRGLLRRGSEDAGEGAPIATTLDGELQALAQRAVQRGIERLARVDGGASALSSGERLLPGRKTRGRIVAIDESALTLDLGGKGGVGVLPLPLPIACSGHPQAAALPPAAERFRLGERLSVRVQSLLPGPKGVTATVSLQPQAALVALDPKSRDILAVVGGYGGKPGDFERATQGLRQAGSTFKPLVYAAALASGRHTAADMVQDLPRMYADGWSPRNFSGTYQGPLRLRAALAHSVNTVAVQVLYDTGIARVVALAGRLGLPPAQLPRDLTLALGTALVSPLQLAGAYATFADTLGGRYLPPRLFDEDPTLPPLDPGSDGGNEALPAGLSYLMTSLLGSVVSEGSAVRARELGIPGLAGKTGTTSAGHDAWFVGYHPGLLAVVWVGDDDGPVAPAGGDDHAGDRTGAETALPLWLDFMRAAQEHGQAAVAPNAPPLPSKDPWPRPPGLGEVKLPEGGTELLLPHTP